MDFPVRSDLDPWMLFIAMTALLASLWTAGAVPGLRRTTRSVHDYWAILVMAGIALALSSVLVRGEALIVPFLLFLAVAGGIYFAGRLNVTGVAWLAIDFLGIAVGWVWGLLFLNDLALPFALEAISMFGLTLTLAMGMLGSVERVAREAVMTHGRWRQPTHAPGEVVTGSYLPRVSVQLPCYAEPPEVVMETMNRLAAQDYDNFEVLIVDNNTSDEALWRPLEAHAATLNARMGREVFRFFHVAPLDGAKAGALNWVMEHMDQGADLVAVIDADYYAEQGFLSRLVPFFRRRNLAYLQTPHDYRDWQDNRYLSACYGEYMPNNKIDMLGVHEYGGAFTIGTMCILRTKVLRQVGGWAEWCLTEDSEVSVRMRAAGYRGIYLGETFGRGLIPDTFEDYKKQRFRWTAGPVQQLVRHWRKFLPSPWARPMPGWTKLLEVLRCIAPLRSLIGLATGLALLVGLSIGIATGAAQPIDIPNIAWQLLPLALATGLVRIWHRYRLADIHRISTMVRGEIARASLAYIVLVAGVAGLSKKPHAWRRTPKFGASGSARAALASALPETVLGLVALAGAAAFALSARAIGIELAALTAFGLVSLGLSFLAAPYMALLAWRENRRAAPAARPPEVQEDAQQRQPA